MNLFTCGEVGAESSRMGLERLLAFAPHGASSLVQPVFLCIKRMMYTLQNIMLPLLWPLKVDNAVWHWVWITKSIATPNCKVPMHEIKHIGHSMSNLQNIQCTYPRCRLPHSTMCCRSAAIEIDVPHFMQVSLTSSNGAYENSSKVYQS